MLVVAAEIRLAAEDVSKYIELSKPMIAASRAEPGNQLYVFGRDILDPCVIRITEQWQDSAALQTHFTLPHTLEFLAAIESLTIEKMEATSYEVSSHGPLTLD